MLTNESQIDKFVEAICAETAIRKDEIQEEEVKTIYFGGGTPSRLSTNHFKKIFEALYLNYKIDSKAEITVEANLQ